MSQFVELLGEELEGAKKQTVETASALAGKHVGLYFSAHWCPPCRGFTPKLAEFYKNNKEKLNLEIVFVSSDRDDAAFDEYFNEMPWLALPFVKRDLKAKLSSTFKVQGIPSFVILSPEGQLITKDGREEVMQDQQGAKFPWTPKTIKEIMSGRYLSKNGDVTEAAFQGKTLGIYFSAHWCPPCRGFTPTLVTFYKNMQAKRSDFELIFVTGDNSQEEFDEYYNEMPWLAVPYDDEDRRNALNRYYEVDGIPHFVIVDAEFNVINDDGRSGVSSDVEGNKFPWPLEDVSAIGESSISHINKRPCLLILTENESEEKDREIGAALESIIAEHKSRAKAGSQLVAFYGKSPINANIRRFLKIEGQDTAFCILSLAEQVKHYRKAEPTAENIAQYVLDYESGSLN